MSQALMVAGESYENGGLSPESQISDGLLCQMSLCGMLSLQVYAQASILKFVSFAFVGNHTHKNRPSQPPA